MSVFVKDPAILPLLQISSRKQTDMAVGQHQCYHFGVGEFTTHFRTYVSGWIGTFTGAYGVLTHGHVGPCPNFRKPRCRSCSLAEDETLRFRDRHATRGMERPRSLWNSRPGFVLREQDTKHTHQGCCLGEAPSSSLAPRWQGTCGECMSAIARCGFGRHQNTCLMGIRQAKLRSSPALADFSVPSLSTTQLFLLLEYVGGRHTGTGAHVLSLQRRSVIVVCLFVAPHFGLVLAGRQK